MTAKEKAEAVTAAITALLIANDAVRQHHAPAERFGKAQAELTDAIVQALTPN